VVVFVGIFVVVVFDGLLSPLSFKYNSKLGDPFVLSFTTLGLANEINFFLAASLDNPRPINTAIAPVTCGALILMCRVTWFD
jgi:hypothetical protein